MKRICPVASGKPPTSVAHLAPLLADVRHPGRTGARVMFGPQARGIGYRAACALMAAGTAVGAVGCAHEHETAGQTSTHRAGSVPPAGGSATGLIGWAAEAQGPIDGGATSAPIPAATVGQPAPDFRLRDTAGQEFTLSQLRGKTIVLEWFNPECPFVNAAHTKGTLKNAADGAKAKGVFWLAINSSAPGRQGATREKNVATKARFGLSHPILLDPTGAVGRAYGATNTPQMFVIDANGTLVYKGAPDNSPDGEGDSPTGGPLVRYVDRALDELRTGRPISTRETQAYGCSIKYATP